MKHDKFNYEPPFIPYADWPHSRVHMWNDTEMAHVVPYDHNCCDHGEEDCTCVTESDVELWNSYSSLSGLTAFSPSGLSAAFDKLNEMGNYSALEFGYLVESANSGIWNSARYIPNVYDNLSALYDILNIKADYSAVSAVAVNTNSAHIVGNGTEERPLRLSKNIINAVEAVLEGTNELKNGLVNDQDLTTIYKDIKALAQTNANQDATLEEHMQLIKLLLNRLPAHDINFINQKVTKSESMEDPEIFYYWDSLKNI